MELTKVILTRRSVRNFRQGNIPDDKIRELIKAAIYAPSAGNCQPWHFYVVKDSRIRKRVYEEACRQEFLTEAPILIIVCIDGDESAGRYGERGKALYNIQNTAAAVQNILLSATDMGLGSCWCGDFDESGLQEIFQMNSERIPVAIVAVGYAGFEPSAPKRKSMDEVADFIGEWEECGEEETSETRKIEHCDMGGTIFHDVNLYGVEISDANLAQGKIFDCNLSNLEIYDCRLDGMKVNGIEINSLL